MQLPIVVRNLGIIAILLCQVKGMSQSSVLATGNWYKVAIEKDGLYKITYDQLKKMGFDPAAIDPQKIKIYGNEGGMLPQPNANPRPEDLIENSIFIEGETDGVFNSGDYILWYAQGPDKSRYDINAETVWYESNLYARKNYYFITIGTTAGKRIETIESTPGNFPIIQQFDDYVYHEVESYNELKSGREWFGERFDLTTEYSFKFPIPGIVENTSIKLISDVLSQSVNTATMNLYINNVAAGSQSLQPVDDSQYAIKGIHKRDTFELNSSTMGTPSKTEQEITYRFTKGSSGKSTAFLDLFLLHVKRSLALYDDQTIFTAASSLSQATSTYVISSATSNMRIWDITDPYNPKNQAFSIQSGTATFSVSSDILRKFVAFDKAYTPELVGQIKNQNLHEYSTPDLIIVSHPDFLTEAQRLAVHRQSRNNWTVVVVTPEQVYHEFSSGRQDVTAIRDFTKHLYDKSPGKLKALALMGRGSYDYHDRISNNTNFIPVYESRNSLDPLQTYSSDDYLGFMEDSEGNWKEGTLPQNHSLDIGVGRLPVTTIDEARAVVDKIIAYDLNKNNYDRWRKDIVFVADDGSNSDSFTSTHQWQANSMADDIDDLFPAFDSRKIFLGTYVKTVKPSGETIPEVNKTIVEDFNRALVINYTGHGSERLWADERILTESDIENLENAHYPFLVTATCEFGRNDDPGQISSAEKTVIQPKGGSIGLVTTARPVYSHTNFALNQAFYDAFFQKESGQYLNLGEIFRRTKNNSLSGVGNRNFSLLADPSLTLALPVLNVVITEIKTDNGSDQLKSLSTVHVKGEIQNASGEKDTDFNGILKSSLFDKRTDFVTIGKNNPPFSFTQWYNVLFRGKATVENGAFEFEFQMPKNIAYENGAGKLSMYAADTARLIDAAGSANSFSIGGSEANPPVDNAPPVITLFMGDTTFINGGIVSPSTKLIARLKDDSGINISNYGIGNNLIAVLDDDEATYILNDYFESDVDDATSGWINFPIADLSPGKHRLTVKAWDLYNNPAQALIEFLVTDGETLIIETFANYPNPFQHETKLYFTHNRAGDDLEGELVIYNTFGATLMSFPFVINSSPYQVNLLEIDELSSLDKKLKGGMYLARVVVRSLTNGSKNERVTKLIAVN